MTEMNLDDAMLREKLQDVVRHAKNGHALSFRIDSAYAQAIIWASERIAELESQTQSPETGSDQVRGLFFRLGYGCETTPTTYCEAVAWGQDRIKKLELENESLSEIVLKHSKSPLLTSPDSEEEIHQRRRRERMLDEVTLICVRDGIERLPRGDAEEQSWGDLARDTATEICWGIDEFDAE